MNNFLLPFRNSGAEVAFRYCNKARTGHNFLSRSSRQIKTKAFNLIGSATESSAWFLATKSSTGYSVMMLWSWFCRKWCESKHRACNSDRLLPDARATRKIALNVRYLNSHLAIGSNGGFRSACSTSERFHCGAIFLAGGLYIWKLRIKAHSSAEFANSVREPQ